KLGRESAVMSARFATSRSVSHTVELSRSTYSTSEKPSSRNSSSARYNGARQMTGDFTRRIFVVSGGGSAAAVRRRLRNEPAAPKDALARKRRRLNPPSLLSAAAFMAPP